MPVSIDPLAPCLGSPAEANLTTRAFYSKLLLHRSVRYTRCIDSNLESGIHIRISRAGSRSPQGTDAVFRVEAAVGDLEPLRDASFRERGRRARAEPASVLGP